MNTKNRTYATVLLILSSFFATHTANAQLSVAGNRIFLSTTPERPAPGDVVRISADSPLLDLASSDIKWYVNDILFNEGLGLQEIAISAGALGSETSVVATAGGADGTVASGEAFIRPVEVDLLWESDSFVPPFYRGRALPSAETSLRLHAIARFNPIESVQVPERDIIYTWKLNDTVVPAASGRGKSFAVLPSPTLFGTDSIEVIASTLDGAKEGYGRATISSVEPMLELYEKHPLFGVMYNSSLSDATAIPDTEMTFSAVPYFAEADSADDPRLNYSWAVNGNDVATDEQKRSEITVNADKSDGLAQIALSITHAVNLYMQSSGKWGVSFGPSLK